MIVVCTGETSAVTRRDALWSIRGPFLVATMEPDWFISAELMALPRTFWSDKLAMMRFVLPRKAIMLGVDKDHHPETWEMIASFHAMGVDVWKVMHSEEVTDE